MKLVQAGQRTHRLILLKIHQANRAAGFAVLSFLELELGEVFQHLCWRALFLDVPYSV